MQTADLITITILEKSRHEDLEFKIRGLTNDLTFDTYYFVVSLRKYTDFATLQRYIADFLQKWVDEIVVMKTGEDRYFPIDLADQCTGCLKVTKYGDELEVLYGYSLTEAYMIDIRNPRDYFTGVTDFERSDARKLRVKQSEFLESLQTQIQKLQ
jgi:hypothetical protein